VIKNKGIVCETGVQQPPKSPDVAAMKQVVTALSTIVKRAKKPAALAKEARDARNQVLLSDYQTEDDINEAYGYASITDDERIMLLDCMNGKNNPKRQDLSEAEIFLFEMKDIMIQAEKRLHYLEWEALSPEDKEQSERRTEEQKEYYSKTRSVLAS